MHTACCWGAGDMSWDSPIEDLDAAIDAALAASQTPNPPDQGTFPKAP